MEMPDDEPFWRTPGKVVTYHSAALALSELERSRRAESESRLRIHQAKWSESFSQIMLDDEGLAVELALEHPAFLQLCRILGLQAQTEFLLQLKSQIVADILQQYCKGMPPYEVKLLVHMRNAVMLGGTARYYAVKRMWSTKNANNYTSTQHWLYCLMLLEQAGWQSTSQGVMLEDDLLLNVVYHTGQKIEVKSQGGNLPFFRGVAILNSETGATPSRFFPVLCEGNTDTVQHWQVVGDPLWQKALSQDIAQLLDGAVGMFGPLSHYREVSSEDLIFNMSAQASVSVTEVDAVKLLGRAGFSTKEATTLIGELLREGLSLTSYNVIHKAIADELPGLASDLNRFNHLMKLGTAPWAG